MWEFLRDNAFITQIGKSRSYVPTVAGLLLFGKTPEDFLVQSTVKAEFRSNGRSAALDIAGPLLSMPEKIKTFLSQYMRTYTEIKGFERTEQPEYPWEAIREAVVNALVHRNYKGGMRIHLQLMKDRLVIKSPGLPLHPLSLAKIRSYNAAPYSRNPRIADTFSRLNLMEERGWGLKKMKEQLVNHGLPPPEFNYDSGYFVVTLFAQERVEGAVRIASDLLARLDKRQRGIIDFIQKHGRIDRAESMRRFKISRASATRYLGGLVELGILEKQGEGRATHYVFVGAQYSKRT
jgi:ATP-dependent DNA helicase RecG